MKKKKLKSCVRKVRAAVNAFNVVGKILDAEPKYFAVCIKVSFLFIFYTNN